jgi:hypothetical protein
MAEKNKRDILVMALFVVTKDSVFSCADELGIPQEQITDDIIELVRLKVSEVLGDWREVVKSMVKETIEKETADNETNQCPLGMECSPSCPYKEIGECTLSRKIE